MRLQKNSSDSLQKNKLIYDENVKKFLSQKIILAHILAYTVKEFRGMEPADIVQYIEGNPEVSKHRVEPDGAGMGDYLCEESPMITGSSTESASRQEGTVYFDIRFYVYSPNGDELIKLIMDIEAQNIIQGLDYDIITRGIYYCARMISEQKGREFVKSDYHKIKKVYSIWICTNCPAEFENTITEYSMERHPIVGNSPDINRYDLQSVIFVGLSKEIADERNEYKLHRLLETFFSAVLSEREKREVIEKEYGIVYSKEIEGSVNVMCNVSDGLVVQGMQQLEDAIKITKEFNLTNPEQLEERGFDSVTSETAIRLVKEIRLAN